MARSSLCSLASSCSRLRVSRPVRPSDPAERAKHVDGFGGGEGGINDQGLFDDAALPWGQLAEQAFAFRGCFVGRVAVVM
jgi:hypothetical protein